MGYEAIIAAAGRGERLGLGIPKALVKICGKTVVERVVDKFVKFDKIRNIYVAVPPGYEPTIGGLLSNTVIGLRYIQGAPYVRNRYIGG